MATDDLDLLADLAASALDDVCPATMTALGDNPAASMRPVVEAVLAEAAAGRWIEHQLEETGLKSMAFRNGMSMEIEPARELVAHWVGAARAMLGDAPNYSETPIEMEVKVAEDPERFAFTLQRVGKLTPHQARQRAEEATADVLRIVSAWCVEANDLSGVDAGDLAFLLEQAGHPLPNVD
jgi:hypothetical protein